MRTLVASICLLLLLPFSASSSSSSSSNSSSIPISNFSFPQQQQSNIITHLPGFEGPLPFQLQTGYVEVDDSNGVRLFYYFIRSERNPAEDPVMLWLTGGPGCSAFSGLVYEIGPLSFDRRTYVDGLPKLFYKPDAWTKVSNVIFLDSPVGTGFSYSVTPQGYESSDTKAVTQIVTFLTKWFDEHPEFLSNPFYVAGDSYSGMIVPAITLEIAKWKEDGNGPALNLKGYLVGNPVTDGNFDNPARVPFAHGMGLISDEMYQAYKDSCGADQSRQQSRQCTSSHDVIDECVKDIWPNHILEPMCTFASPHRYNLKLSSGAREMLRLQDYTARTGLQLSEISTECRPAEYLMSRTWANNEIVREALGIRMGTVPLWIRCNDDILYANDIHSSVKHHLEVTTRGYKCLVYSGDHDMIIPFIGTQAWIRSLNFSVVNEWRPWYVDAQVAGYTRSYSNNLTFATVKVRDLDVILSHFSISVHRPYLYANGRGCSMVC
ncbi:serine carboxypeptidase-like 15 isoform X1 [Lolium rigidum]|uniref:serine carboxypeptidase-like 15 isoform X1 n=1 Tax=Lolium rigidum TaxID=89674 RepID=UPI001F5DE7E1|nr:serine carboxypeptidase-like 15 isoform X1 [Lolium rigidum]